MSYSPVKLKNHAPSSFVYNHKRYKFKRLKDVTKCDKVIAHILNGDHLSRPLSFTPSDPASYFSDIKGIWFHFPNKEKPEQIEKSQWNVTTINFHPNRKSCISLVRKQFFAVLDK